MARAKGYAELEPLAEPPAPGEDPIDAQREASRAARAAELEAEKAAELAEQERLREAVKAAERSVGPAPSALQRQLQQVRLPENDVGDAVEDVVADGLLGEEGEQLVVAEAEAAAGSAQPAAAERAMNEGAEQVGCNGHRETSRDANDVTRVIAREIESDNLGDARLEAMLARWLAWCDDERGFYGRDDATLAELSASAETANATDPYFVTFAYEETFERERALFARPGLEAAAKRWEQHQARRPPLSADDLEKLRAHFRKWYPGCAEDHIHDAGSFVQIISDRAHLFPGGDAQAFVRDYLRTLPLGWTESVVISLQAGAHPVICRATKDRVLISTTEKWAKSLPWTSAGAQRFVALESYAFGNHTRVMIPPAVASKAAADASIHDLAKRSAPETPTAVAIHPTGIADLDAALALGGVPTGSRVVIQAETGNGKTTFLLEAAESLAARGVLTVWYATGDDTRDKILARRRQRIGVPRREAMLSTDESALAVGLVVIDGLETTLEEVLSCKSQIGALFIDPLSKVRMSTCESSDPVARIGHALDLVEASGVMTWMALPTVRGLERRKKIERALGGQRVESGAMLLLDLRLDGEDLSVEILKSRFGGKGTELALRLDEERQRVLPAASGAGGGSKERIWEDMKRVLAERGPRSPTALCGSVPGKTETKREVVRERLAAGDLVQLGRNVGLR